LPGPGHGDRVSTGWHDVRATLVASLVTGVWSEDGNTGLLADHLQLGDRVGTLEVRCDQQRGVALVAQPQGELTGQGRLASTLQTGEQDHRGRVLGEPQLAGGTAQDGDQLVVDDLDDLLGRVEGPGHLGRQRPLSHRPGERPDHRQRDVSVEQGAADLADSRIDIGLGQPSPGAQGAERGGEPVGQGGEHRGPPRRSVQTRLQ